ncbi:2-polyprenyl-3-methyl-5-hydroxy-6-metoxy-1,4-benzoquinol methylase [Jatrophihabitans sp. GAS493]|uniref:class I SAM-dependent methyltransferase n=1 Tax=Jatrophihabitans sp. GAS493 TaxID=1907575 RepID=UPI000BC0D62A|nr:class I SAM-dependent methyltransferase [Jatrophihabitans sp. GAS493]SOD73010.1 2-polyprenyl-3-methyl-5-hydroxy-6-metoxy-1,4-benzoquinol methylase [Jatrophihabitans sp. GAS493]
MSDLDSGSARRPQLAYSELQEKTKDEAKRRRKAEKIVAVLQHFLGRTDLSGLTSVDIGCSTGYTADALHEAGSTVIGLDIDVPGLAHADSLFGQQATFLCADGAALPFADASVDIVVFNHIYEHVVDPDRVLSEIRRVLSPNGSAYFAFGNKRGVIEPHYRLPFLSWLPKRAADRYVSATGRADDYYEQFRTRPNLIRMCAGLKLWDYTYTVLADSERFHARDMVPARLAAIPPAAFKALAPVMPTFVWVGTPGDWEPAGSPTRERPRLISTP